MAYSESEWRCPTDGAFHVVDLSKENRNLHAYPCTKCGNQVFRELLDEGMANALEQHTSEKPAPEKPYVLADLDAFNAALKDWFQATYPYRMGESIHAMQAEERERRLKLRQVKSMDLGCRVPRIPSGLSWDEALIWCQDFILSRLPETMVRHIVRSYPEVSHHVKVADPDFETVADDFHGLRFRIYVVDESQDTPDECRDLYGHRIAPERWESLPADTKEYLRLVNGGMANVADKPSTITLEASDAPDAFVATLGEVEMILDGKNRRIVDYHPRPLTEEMLNANHVEQMADMANPEHPLLMRIFKRADAECRSLDLTCKLDNPEARVMKILLNDKNVTAELNLGPLLADGWNTFEIYPSMLTRVSATANVSERDAPKHLANDALNAARKRVRELLDETIDNQTFGWRFFGDTNPTTDVCVSSTGSHSHQLQGTWGVSPVEQARAEVESSLRPQQYSKGVSFPKELIDDFNCASSSNGRALQTKVISDSNSDITYSVSYSYEPDIDSGKAIVTETRRKEDLPFNIINLSDNTPLSGSNIYANPLGQSYRPGDMVALTSTGKVKKAGSGDTARGWFITPNASVSVAGGPLVYISGSSGTGATASCQSYDPIIRGPSFYHGSNTFEVSFEWLEENGFERVLGGKVSFAGGNGTITMIDHVTLTVTVTCDHPLSDGGVEVHKSFAVGPSPLTGTCSEYKTYAEYKTAYYARKKEADSAEKLQSPADDSEDDDTATIPTDLRVPDNFHVQECLCVRMEFDGYSELDTETWTTAVGAQARAKQLLFGCEEIRACEIVTVWKRGEH